MPPSEPPSAVRFSLLWAQAQGAVASYIHAVLPDRLAADELVQEVAVAAFRNLDQRRPEGSFTGWCLGIARNRLRMRWRGLARSRAVFADPELLDRLAAINVELDAAMSDERTALRRCLEGVGGRAFDLLRLHYVDGLTPTAVAARLAIAAGTVRVQLHRLRAALRACIERRLASGDRDA